ncbi:MAG: tetratricopeptide repeat protein [Spirochaetaceae bacterium]|jgi:Tfp pilus assembly protein PilF|nr:tetratricopeptide repeat protein [Spirochaetaceae bacterium]
MRNEFAGLLALGLIILGCGTFRETPISLAAPAETEKRFRTSEGGAAEEIRRSAEMGTPSSLQTGLNLIRDRGLGTSDFGRVMAGVITTLTQKVYPNSGARVSTKIADLPQTYRYAKILQEAALGRYVLPQAGSQDYLEYVLPFLSLLQSSNPQDFAEALPHLRQARELNPESPIAPYFMGLAYERIGPSEEGAEMFRQAWELSEECYPAALGLARVLNQLGESKQALRILQDLTLQFPDLLPVKRDLARAYYQAKEWSRAESSISEILQQNPREGPFLLMLAQTLAEQKQFLKAGSVLDQYGALDTNNPQYLFLRARIQAEGYHNADAALTYLRSLLNRPNPGDEVPLYAAGLLLASPRLEEQAEGRSFLEDLLKKPNPPAEVFDIAFQDAARREAWTEAKTYLPRLQETATYLMKAYRVEQGLGNKERALDYAQQLQARYPEYEEGHIAYTAGLIALGKYREAEEIIENRLPSLKGGTLKGQYYYLRSQLRQDEDKTLQDLRSSLFEDPQNIDALLAILEIYRKQGDARRAGYYYRQAQSFDPNNPRVRFYDRLYAE